MFTDRRRNQPRGGWWLLLGLWLGCSKPAVVAVTIEGLPIDAVKLVTSAYLNGRGLAAIEPFALPQTTLGLTLPEGSSGDLYLDLAGLLPSRCIGARGEGRVSIPGPGRYDLPVKMKPLSDPDCTVLPAGQICSQDDWCWQYPRPMGNRINATWAIAANDVWAVGSHGTFMHFDGSAWSMVRDGLTREQAMLNYNGVWGSARDQVYAVGDKGTILRFDGQKWARPYEYCDDPKPTRRTTLKGISGSDKGIRAVGDGLMVRLDGKCWREQGDFSKVNLQAISRGGSAGAEDVWIVGLTNDNMGVPQGYAAYSLQDYWQHINYPVVPPPGQSGEFKVWVAGKGDFWISSRGIEYYTSASNTFTQILPMNSGGPTSLWGTGPSEIWATTNVYGIYRCDSTKCVFVPVSAKQQFFYEIFYGITGTSDDLWFAGLRGAIRRRLIDEDKVTRWFNYRLDTDDWVYTGVWGSGPRDVWAVGVAGSVRHYDGFTWTPVPFEDAGKPALKITDVWGSSADDVWFVGNDGMGAGEAWRLQSQGGKPTRIALPGSNMSAVWTDSAAQAFAVGEKGGTGQILRLSNAGVVEEHLSGPKLKAVWGSGEDVWAVGENATILRRKQGKWEPAPTKSLPNVTLSHVWGSGPQDVWATGAGNTILHYDGVIWNTVPHPEPQSGPNSAFLGIWGTGPTDVWFVGDAGTLLHWDGKTWSIKDSGTGNTLFAIWGASADKLWAVGDGAILQYQPR